jgi:16S rRNA (cytosine1402-N4)-methyltransferase
MLIQVVEWSAEFAEACVAYLQQKGKLNDLLSTRGAMSEAVLRMAGAMVEGPENTGKSHHQPVLLNEVVKMISPRDGGIYADGTFGGGGYARALLEEANCNVYAIDRDPEAIEAGAGLAATYPGRLMLIEGSYSDMEEQLKARGVSAADGVVLDIGVSSMQLDDPARGFSFQKDGPLDMRMGRKGVTAAEIVNGLPEAELKRIIAVYGEERRAGTIARAIARARTEKPITRTGELARLIEQVMGRRPQDPIHPATRTFQALRIHLNRELDELVQGLAAAERLLKPRGRLAVVSFHSLEDRIVKRFLAERSGRTGRPSRHMPEKQAQIPTFEIIGRRPVTPTAEEVSRNPRARSAKLRAAVRTEAPPKPVSTELLALASIGGQG